MAIQNPLVPPYGGTRILNNISDQTLVKSGAGILVNINCTAAGDGTNFKIYDGAVLNGDTVAYLTLGSAGNGYGVDGPSVTISPPDDPNGIQATAIATTAGGSVVSLEMVNHGRGYLSTPTVTIDPPETGDQADATATIGYGDYQLIASIPGSVGINRLYFPFFTGLIIVPGINTQRFSISYQ